MQIDYLLILGLLAATCTTAAFLPQVFKAHFSKQTKDLSLAMFVLLSIGLILWAIYGVVTRALPLVLANTATLLLTFYMIFLKLKHG
jgi:MtN3 and saliva related transmembrane protein